MYLMAFDKGYIMEDIHVEYDKKVWLPEKMVEDAIFNKWEVSLSYFIQLKQFYSNNTYYNYSYRSISDKTGIPLAVLYRHIKKLKSKGLIRTENGHLTLVGANKLNELYKSYLIAVKVGETKQQTILNIQFTRILRNLRQQKQVVSKKIEIKELQKPKFMDATKAKKLLKFRNSLKNAEISEKDYYLLSNKKFGSLNNRSKSTGIAIQKKMNDSGLLTSNANWEKYSDYRFDRRGYYELCLPSCYRLSAKGYVYRVLPNSINIECSK